MFRENFTKCEIGFREDVKQKELSHNIMQDKYANIFKPQDLLYQPLRVLTLIFLNYD